MAGRHSKRGAHAPVPEQREPRPARVTDAPTSNRSRWRRSSARAVVPVPRPPGIEVVDAETGMAHQVSAEELRAGRARGDYQGFCGARFLAASMVEPGRGRRPGCVS
jgi:hypothetical protein